ncbi:MAG: efflux RND transporter periplasmic adaptor subunit [Phormidesmis sp. CAN_BIN36]|nr:efflux RND transporter periplasmic adaptor subunit [Phormidesmis sp. CAN_BIN36]
MGIRVDAEAATRMGIKVEPVARQRLKIAIKTTGQIEPLPDQKVLVTAPIQGRIVQLLAKPGSSVNAGQVVALLSSPELAQLRVEAISKRDEAEAGLQQARADLQLAQQNYERQRLQAIAELKQAQTQVALVQERYDRNRELQAAGAITRRQVQESQTELSAAQATLTKAQSRLGELEATAQLSRSQAGVSVAQSRVRLSSAAYDAQLSQLKATANADGLVQVTAPISGRVVDRPITPGETVTVEAASKPIMTLINDDRVLASGNVYEKDLDKVKTGQRVRVIVKSLPNRSFEGRIADIGTVIEGTTRVVPVKAELNNSNQSLKSGMFAELEILTEQSSTSVMAIPNSAIVNKEGKTIVFVQQADSYHPVEVTLGQQSGNWVEVKQGLKDGDRIVTEGVTLLAGQSAEGSGTVADNDDKPKQVDNVQTNEFRDLWWLTFPVGGAIAFAFWAGRRSRSPGKLEKVADYETEIHLERSKSLPETSNKPEDSQPPHQD